MHRPCTSAARTALFVLALAALPAARGAVAAGPDGIIDMAHVSHIAWQDRRPLCPVDRESFTVRLYAPAGDLAAVRVHFVDAANTWVDAARTGVRGACDTWQATLPSAAAMQVRYWFELSDGAARAYVSASGVSPAPPADSGWVVDFATLSHAPLGATLLPGGGTVFRVWAPGATDAYVRGDFNGWGMTPMARVGQDFVARIPEAADNDQYKFYFASTNHWSVDARGRVLDPASWYWNSRIADPLAFAWTDSLWQAPPVDRMVVYQLNVGTFAGLNDPNGPATFPARFADVAVRAKELKRLGVNAVLFNPVTSTPSLTYAGYSTLGPWSPEWTYGMPDDFKAVVDALHRAGIAVLCDIVWNHFDPNTNHLWNYDGTQCYFETPAANTPWGPQAAFGRAGVDDWYVDSALHWLEEYHVDGFRMDAAGYMASAPHETGGWALMQRFNGALERRRPGAVTIAENFPMQPSFVTPAALDGAGFTTQYYGDFRYQVLYAIPNNLGYSYPGYLAYILTPAPGVTAAHQQLNYFELHDDAWDTGGRHRFWKDLAPTAGVLGDTAQARMKVAMGILMLTPGVPAMLMGDEWLEIAGWGTTPANRIDWSLRTANAGYYAYVQELVGLRTGTPAFWADTPSLPTHYNYSDGVFGWVRHDDLGRMYLVVVNLGDEDFPVYMIGAPRGGTWIERLNSQAAAYGGTGLVNETPLTAYARAQDGYPRTLDLRLPRSSVVVLQAQATADVADGVEEGPLRIERVWPNPSRGPLRVDFALPRAGEAEVAVYDTQGRRVATLAHGAQAAGRRAVAWDGRDAAGRRAAAGLYFVRLSTAEGHATRRVALVP
jgi:1,4-alpha-glucan branching enzyme